MKSSYFNLFFFHLISSHYKIPVYEKANVNTQTLPFTLCSVICVIHQWDLKTLIPKSLTILPKVSSLEACLCSDPRLQGYVTVLQRLGHSCAWLKSSVDYRGQGESWRLNRLIPSCSSHPVVCSCLMPVRQQIWSESNYLFSLIATGFHCFITEVMTFKFLVSSVR